MTWNAESSYDCGSTSDVRHRIQNSSSGWRPALDRPGVYAAYIDHEFSADTAIQLSDRRGVILGTIYQSPEIANTMSPTPIRHLSQRHTEEILQSAGRSLISDCWGHYVSVLYFPEKTTTIVMRSPASRLPCFQLRDGTMNVFFSNLDDCASLKVTPLTINWDSITAQVVGGDYLTNETAIEEITGIECGESVECSSSNCSRHVYWDPRVFLADRSLSSFSDATHAVRHATDYCVSASSSAHSNILVKLSGGLDSSIVLSALSRAPHEPSITAVNFHSRGCGDERRFARIMARRANCEILERPRNDQLDLHRFLDCNRTVRPVLNFSAPDVETRNIALARELNATAIFDGELGDNIFGSHPSPGALVECFRQTGLGRGFLDVAFDYSLLTRQSLW